MGIGPYGYIQGVRGKKPPVTASPCRGPLGKGAMGTGVRIATTSLQTGLAMTPFTRGAVQHRRADRVVRPYGAIRGVVRDRVGRPQGSPLRMVYKRRGWSWHAVYAYIRIYTIYTRKSLAEFAARRRQKNSNHFSPRHVRGEKYRSGCKCRILPLAAKLCAQQTANPFGRKFRRNFLPVKKETPEGVSFFV